MRNPQSHSLMLALLAGAAIAAVPSAAMAASADNSCWSKSFTSVDSDGDGTVSRSEATDFQSRIFSWMDENGDGDVDRLEYTKCTFGTYGAATANAGSAGASAQTGNNNAGNAGQAGQISGQISGQTSGATGSIEAARNDFRNVDTDKDQFVTRDEYLRGAEKSYKVGGLAMGRDAQGSGSTASGDNDGMTPEDYGAALFAYGSDGSTADRNRDQRVSEGEAAADVSDMFTRRDTDSDNRLSEQEWLSSSRDAVIERRFNAIDADGNGQISQSEYNDAENRSWQQSQAGTSEPISVWHYRAIYVPVVVSDDTSQPQSQSQSPGGNGSDTRRSPSSSQ